MKYKVTTDSKEYDVEIRESDEGLKVRVGKGEELLADFQAVSKGKLFSMLVNNESYRVIINKKQNKHAVYTRGHRFNFDVEDERTYLMRTLIGGAQAKMTGEVKAPIPGLVTKIHLREGDHIDQGQGVLILEAMKMENEIKSPAAGKIKKIMVQSGKNVEKGQPLFIVE